MYDASKWTQAKEAKMNRNQETCHRCGQPFELTMINEEVVMGTHFRSDGEICDASGKPPVAMRDETD